YLSENKKQHKKLYFVKVDIKSCFDRIPQKKVLKIAKDMISEESYVLGKYIELISANFGSRATNNLPGSSITKKFINIAKNEFDCTPFKTFAITKAERKKHVIFVEKINSYHRKERQVLESLLEEHVEYNIVKVLFLYTHYTHM